jgi:hypothetical protein
MTIYIDPDANEFRSEDIEALTALLKRRGGVFNAVEDG